MRDLLEQMATRELTEAELTQLELVDLIRYYDGYHITYLGWMLLLRGRAPAEQIKAILEIEEPEYLFLLEELKEKSL